MKTTAKMALATMLAVTPWLGAQAETWDAAADFSATTGNPNVVWSYGYDPAAQAGYQFKGFDQFITSATILAWRDSGYNSLDTPAFFKNLSAGTVNGTPSGQVALHPGPVANGDAAILRFSAPEAGAYAVSAQFFAGDSGETDAWVVLNGDFASPLATLGITSVNPGYTNASLWLNAGDTLDFVVGNHGSYFSDTTPLAVQIATVVPEPASAALLAGGLMGLMGLSRRRRSA